MKLRSLNEAFHINEEDEVIVEESVITESEERPHPELSRIKTTWSAIALENKPAIDACKDYTQLIATLEDIFKDVSGNAKKKNNEVIAKLTQKRDDPMKFHPFIEGQVYIYDVMLKGDNLGSPDRR